MVADNQDHLRVPTSELDLVAQMSNPAWGSSEVSHDLKAALETQNETLDEDGNKINTVGNFWGLLSYYNRDVRLANLSEWNGELLCTRYNLDLAGDFLLANMIEPFMIKLKRGITIMETSQSKGGFFRRNLNTLRHENYSETNEPPKKAFFGGGVKREGF